MRGSCRVYIYFIHANVREKIKRIFFPICFNELVAAAAECFSSSLYRPIYTYIYIIYIYIRT